MSWFSSALGGGAVIAALAMLAACSDDPSPGGPGAPAGGDAGGATGSAGGAGAGAPYVAFAEPGDGVSVANPVRFVVEAAGVDEVEIFADETYSLAPAWDPADRDWLLYRFGGTGLPRPIHVAGRAADGTEVARDDITITVEPDSCEDRFFVTKFDEHNQDASAEVDLTLVREDALAALKSAIADLQACGAAVTVGGMMSLLLYEGAFRAAAFNTLCEENSYNQTATDCDLDPEALYSYQFGLGAIHTSNFHPCKGGSWTQTMRDRFVEHAGAAGFDVGAALVTPEIAARFTQVCPGATPGAVDYYLLGAHDLFGIPRDAKGNHLIGVGEFPLFSAAVSIRVTFHQLAAACASIGSDGEAIAVFGGGDPSYDDPAKQAEILGLYQSWAAANCGR